MLVNAQQMKIIKLADTFQIIKYNLNRKYVNANCREFSCQKTNTKSKTTNGSSFLIQFMKNENNKQSLVISNKQESFCRGGKVYEKKNYRTTLNTNEGQRFATSFMPQPSVYNTEPIFATVKAFTPTSDDILFLQDESEFEDNGNIICRNNYKVSVLSRLSSCPPIVLEQTFNKYSRLTDFEKPIGNMVRKLVDNQNAKLTTENKVWTGGKAKPEHLENIFNKLSHNLPRFFTQPHDYSIYTPDIEFNNNIQGTRSKGLAPYMQQLAFVRIIGHLKFAHVRFEVLKITKHPDDDTIRVRWRIRGLSAFKAFFKVLSIKYWDKKKLLEEESDWYDGFSIFYLSENGLVYRHDCEKMIPDKERKIESSETLAAKLALILGTFQWPSLSDVNTVMTALSKVNIFHTANSATQSIVK